MLIITSPGQFEVTVLNTYAIEHAEDVCKSEAKRVQTEMRKAYPSANDKDTFELVCLKQKEKEA
jgi:hypothetical protein